MIENTFAKELYKKYIIRPIQHKLQRTLIIGIDGPTASGKTILADNLKAEIEKKRKKMFHLQTRLDSYF